MTLAIEAMVLGPAATNAYLIADSDTGEAAAIDPAWDGEKILARADRRGWRIGHIWLTHAHFDHLGGAGAVADGSNPPPPVALHPDDYWLWRAEGGASLFGLSIDPGPEPTIDLFHGQILRLGSSVFEVRHAPGHTPGHVMFYCKAESLVFCGDVIFRLGIGRFDLPGGNYDTLMASIGQQVLSLPDETRLLNGHGEATTVGFERAHNPFLAPVTSRSRPPESPGSP